MYKVYGILQGEEDIDYSVYLPGVAELGTIGRIFFYTWCIKSNDATLLIDTGVNDATARRLSTAKFYGGADYLETKLKQLDIDPARIEKVIVSHLHADHFSAHELYPKATFYIQKREIDFLGGPAAKFRQVTQYASDVAVVTKLARARRVHYVEGDEHVAPGIRLALVGGHTPGSQVTVVTTRLGKAVICGDVVQFYRQLEEKVTGLCLDVVQTLFAGDKIRALASFPELIIPGHDPSIMTKFPNPVEGIVEIA